MSGRRSRGRPRSAATSRRHQDEILESVQLQGFDIILPGVEVRCGRINTGQVESSLVDPAPLPAVSMADLPPPPALIPIGPNISADSIAMAMMPTLSNESVIVPNPNPIDLSQRSDSVVRPWENGASGTSTVVQQQSANDINNDSVIILSDEEDDDEIVCIATKYSRPVPKRFKHRHVRRPPPTVDIPDSPPPAPVPKLPEPPVLPPEPVGKVRKCPVCLDTFDAIEEDPNRNLKATKCGHIFCEPCLVNSLKQTKNCPLCKQKITSIKATHTIFL